MQNNVRFRVPDFVAEDGTVFTEIEITVQSDDHDAVQLLKTLERPGSIDND